jgi:hypothetical protein
MSAPIPPSDVAGGTTATSAWANAVSDAIQQLIADLYPAGALSMAWANVTGKPLTFAPTVHAHADAASGGTVAYAAVTGKPATFAPTVHVHQAAAATGGRIDYADLTSKPTSMAPTAHTHPYSSDITSKPATFAPSNHHADHADGGSDEVPVTYAQLTGKPATFAPTAHTHPYGSDITSKPATFAPSDHAANHRTGGGDAITAGQIGGWNRVAAGDTLGTKIFVGRGAPTGMAEGDVWIVG